eukprot:7021073-Lingulodinium_polyedra.AAC.1
MVTSWHGEPKVTMTGTGPGVAGGPQGGEKICRAIQPSWRSRLFTPRAMTYCIPSGAGLIRRRPPFKYGRFLS